MNAGDIITLFRREVDDTVEPYLWSDEEAMDFLNDAQNEACRRTRALVDSSTAAVCQLTVPTTGIATLDERVLFVRNVRFSGRAPLRRMNMQDMVNALPTWEDAAASTYPDFFIADWQTGKLRFFPKPSAELTALLTVVRDPLAEMNSGDDEPELPARWHRSLRFWMAHRAYSKPDEETYNPKKAAEYEVAFEREFGPRSAAIDEMWIQREQFEGDGTY
jgi:hypothetical protein